MREIELKYKINDNQDIIGILNSLGCDLSGEIVQKDKVYSRKIDNKHSVFRIRTQEYRGIEKTLLTLKQDITSELDCLESEIEVDDADKTEEMLEYWDLNLELR
ncbi:MAG: hypothetical protein Q9M76_05570 [Candidatus Dojkabacteria bacterium]|nr:hypothetical protein [Candidatus Dojkabacteria bacterium]